MPWISGAVLVGGAAFFYPGRDYVLIGLMLFLPLADRRWAPPSIPRDKRHFLVWGLLLLTVGGLLMWQPQHWEWAISTLLLAALPEEWFFRAYFMPRLGGGWRANVIASLLFSLLHGLSHDWQTAILVYPASLFYGWLYQRTGDLPLLVLVHALSNLVFILFLSGIVADLMRIMS